VPWTKPDDWRPDAENLMKPFQGPHPGGFITARCDGSVGFLTRGIDPETFKALLTVAGEEPINAEEK
jgi:hypothetical protein